MTALWLATLGGIGRCPVAPATVATALVGIPFALFQGLLPLPAGFIFMLAVVALSCVAAEGAERALGRHDPQEVVIDELAGFLVTMVGLPLSATSLLLGFAAFRLFDITKPWPVCILHHRFTGGISVVMDDVGAGIYAHLLVWLALRLLA